MSNAIIILQILLITIVMLIFGIVLNRILGLKKEKMKEFKDKALNIQERMKNARVLGDIRLMAQLQRETMQFTRQIMLKQFVPLCVRCVIFIGIFSVLSFIYSDYDSGLLPFNIFILGTGWVALYFLFSIGFSLIIFGVKKLYKRIAGKEVSTQSNLRELIGIISPTQPESGITYGLSDAVSPGMERNSFKQEELEKEDSWKDRIQK
ncbi:MAG: hypothetical protein ACXABO_10925 [Promethearchaeota archaeon]|jgi:uncharacterized membrane protein (DUF106 family)